MKLKTFLLSGFFLILLFSCENRDDFTTVDIDTEIVAELSFIVEPGSPPELKSQTGEEVFSFEGTGIFCLAQNNDLGKPMCIFQNLQPCQGCKVVFSEFEEEGSILSMQLKWDSKSSEETDFDMENEVNIVALLQAVQNNGNLEIDITNIIDPLVECIGCNPNCMFRIDIKGTADFNIPAKGLLKIPVTAERNIYTTKYSLF